MNTIKIMSESIILITKDALGSFYLPVYGNQYWKGRTPNIDELAAKGTVFLRHYTAAPSSAMSYFSMFTGVYAHETNRKDYLPIKKPESIENLFDKAFKLGYKSHIIWDSSWMTTSKLYSECYGEHVVFNDIEGIKQSVGAHQQHDNILSCDENKVSKTLERIHEELEKIMQVDSKVFIWMHLPHVLYGRNGYGTDIDIYDKIIGLARQYFLDENIFISSDHGNMNGTHGKIGYGFDVYEPASRIPLISPRIDNCETIDFPTSTCDLFDLIFQRKIVKREFVYSDSAYYGQLNRKLAIIHGKYKLIYNRRTHAEELYDVVYDPNETTNLISNRKYDVDRHLSCLTRELYFYDSWDALDEERSVLRSELSRIWRVGNFIDRCRAFFLYYGKNIHRLILVYRNKLRKMSKRV